MDHRTLFGIATVLLSGAIFLHSLNSATASMPVGMQHGQFPYQHFTECDLSGASPNGGQGCVPSTGVHTLLTVPSDRIFVITGAVSSYSYACFFENDGLPLVSYDFLEGNSNRSKAAGPLISGNAHYTIDAGSTLDVNIGTTSCRFYIEGYFAHL